MMGCSGYGFGGYGAFGGIGMILGLIIHLAFIAVVIMGAIWLFRAVSRNLNGAAGPNAMAILQQRYAKGEIDYEEYIRIKKELA